MLPSGAPDSLIRFAAIAPAPKVRIAPIDGPFDTDKATYSPGDGSIVIPREYQGTTWRLEVRIDGALLAPGTDYVFEVRSYKGHPEVQHGNFAPVDYPYGSAIVFTRTFKIS